MIARCPSCRETFSTDRSGQQNCPNCGKPLIVPEQPKAPMAELVTGSIPRFGDAPFESEAPPAGTPWERRPEQPWFAAWKDTVMMALFEPAKLFSLTRLEMRKEQTTFAVLTYTVFQIIGQLLNQLLVGPQTEKMMQVIRDNMGSRVPPAMMKYLEESQHPTVGHTVLSLLLAPLMGLIFLYLNACFTHLFAMVFGQNRKGFAATFAACAYATAPAILLAIPGCGSFIAVIWVVVLIGIGMKHTHGISTGGATATALGPYLLFCCGGCALLLMGGMALGSMAGGGLQ